MRFDTRMILLLAILTVLSGRVTARPEPAAKAAHSAVLEISRDALLDRLYGGWMGMLIGGIEGLEHENKYVDQPRESLPEFAFLPDGARSDDDNDFELTHLYFMDRDGVLKLPYARIVEIWKANMNTGIWIANAGRGN